MEATLLLRLYGCTVVPQLTVMDRSRTNQADVLVPPWDPTAVDTSQGEDREDTRDTLYL